VCVVYSVIKMVEFSSQASESQFSSDATDGGMKMVRCVCGYWVDHFLLESMFSLDDAI